MIQDNVICSSVQYCHIVYFEIKHVFIRNFCSCELQYCTQVSVIQFHDFKKRFLTLGRDTETFGQGASE